MKIYSFPIRPLLVMMLFILHGFAVQGQDAFITTWKTDNPGTSNSTSITIPTFSGETYNYDVDWDNDGTFDTIGVTGNITHDYGVADTVTIRIQGDFPRIYFNFSGDRQKILSVDQWGTIAWTSMEKAFYVCNNLNILASDAPDLSNVTSTKEMFRGCENLNASLDNWNVSTITNMQSMFEYAISFNGALGNWDVSNVENMYAMFFEAYAFNQDITGWNTGNVTTMQYMFAFTQSFNQAIGSWDVSSVNNVKRMFEQASGFDQSLGDWDISSMTDMTFMFSAASLSPAIYDATLSGWNTLDAGETQIPTAINFNGGSSVYCNSGAARDSLIDIYGWTITDGGFGFCDPATHFITTWKTDNPGSSNSTSITIPTFSGESYNYDVDWNNDGVFDTMGIMGNFTHDFGAAGTKTIRIRGDFPRIYFNNGGDRKKILSVNQWGSIAWTSHAFAFSGCENLTVPATDAPDLSNVTSLRYMFTNCKKFNESVNHWDVSNVTDMLALFRQALDFNQPLDNWDVSNTTDMSSMFEYIQDFNQDLSSWDVSNVINMSYMFHGCYYFNSNITGWDVSNVTNFRWMFQGCGWFAQNIGVWDVSSATNMEAMFSSSTFNRDISSWDVSSVVNMKDMFSNTTYFDQNISGWDVSNVTNFSNMFINAAKFNQPIGAWNVSSATTMQNMFHGAALFNQNLNSWNVSAVTNFINMFRNNNVFNQDISSWDVSSATTMEGMFFGASAFNQNIGSWNVGQVTNFTDMFKNAGQFNQNIGGWDVSSATTMVNMFWGTTSFNQDIGNWEVGQVTDFSNMFLNAVAFNQDIGNWDMSSNISLQQMFSGASSFNQDIGSWDVSQVSNFNNTFVNAGQFNQDIGNWDVSSATSMRFMFSGATNFDQNLSTWDVSQVSDMTQMFNGVTLSIPKYDSMLIAWSQLPLQSNINLNGGGSHYCSAVIVRAQIIDQFNWSIADAGLSCSADRQFVTTWQTDLPGITGSSAIKIPANGPGFLYDVDWNNDGVFDQFSITGSIEHDFGAPGTYTIRIQGAFPEIRFSGATDKQKITSLNQWGDLPWVSLSHAFDSCVNLTLAATDIPDLTFTTQMDAMFYRAENMNAMMNDWNVSHVQKMDSMFMYAISFNQPLDNWDVSGVTDMAYMFAHTPLFDQSLSTWNTGQVTNMKSMFEACYNFNQDISSWNTQNVVSLQNMFYGDSLFNSQIGNWNVENVQDFSGMLTNAIAFDQDLSDWDISSLLDATDMFLGAGISTPNYDSLLMGWARLDAGESMIPDNITFHGGNSKFCSGWDARDSLISNHGWTITDGGSDMNCSNHFVTTWKTDNAGTSGSTFITIPTFIGDTYNYDVDWDNDGIFDTLGVTGDVTYDFGVEGTYTIRIRGAFPHIYFNGGGDRQKLLSVDQWGDIEWSSMKNAFRGCYNLHILASDAPDLSMVTDMDYMFSDCLVMNEDIGFWDVSQVTDMNNMFNYALAFNQDISAWDVSQVTNMSSMFYETAAFNQNINSWNVGQVLDMSYMFAENPVFNQPLSNWDVSNAIDMSNIFDNAASFNGDVSTWDVSSVQNLTSAFRSCSMFDQNLSGWDVSNVINMTNMFHNDSLSVDNYDNLLIAWSQLPVQPNLIFSGGNSRFCAGGEGRYSLTSIHNWTITDGGQPDSCDAASFIATWKTDNPGTSGNTSITIPTFMGDTYSYDVDWDNDGQFDSLGITGDVTHNFGVAGTYTIRIRGTFPHLYFNYSGDRQKLLAVNQWGDNVWGSMSDAFRGCWNLHILAIDTPDLSMVTDMDYMFADCEVMNEDISFWDVSQVTDMNNMFNYALSFNQDISSWDVSQVLNMNGMFFEALAFNQDISSWNVGQVQNMNSMFAETPVFNQDLSGWNVSNVNDMAEMFYNADAFNGNISGWDVSSVTTMNRMFSGATGFDQNLSTWDVSQVTDMTNMFQNIALSMDHYDAMLIAWSQLPVQSNVVFSGGNSIYCAGADARDTLIIVYNWTITDGGGTTDCHFVTTWKTDNPGFSNSTSITIPTGGAGYNYDVDWNGDGIFDEFGLTGNATHDYGAIGTYTVRLRGDFPRIAFAGNTDHNKILSIEQWGNIKWTTMVSAFATCSNLLINASDAPDLSNVTTMANMFANCTSLNSSLNHWDVSHVTIFFGTFLNATTFNGDISSWDVSSSTLMLNMFFGASAFNQDIGGWDVSGVANMAGMFNGATSFDQNIGSWDISSVTNIANMFNGASLSTMYYDSLLIGWARLDPGENQIPSGLTFNGGGSNYCLGAMARDSLISTYGWTISDGGVDPNCPSEDFVTTWKTNNPGVSNSSSITIPTYPGETYNYAVDWDNDGTFDTLGVTGDITHDYGVAGTYTIRVRGDFPRIYFHFEKDRSKLLSINQWGNIAWTSMHDAFAGCDNLNCTVPVPDMPDLSSVTDMDNMFYNCYVFTGENLNIGDWDVSTVTTMSGTFAYTFAFNQSLNNWDVSQVTNMSHLFREATSFNQPLNNWDVSNVTDMSYLFFEANSFNQPLDTWNVSNVSTTSEMFTESSFNQPINSWDVSNVADMSGMFRGTPFNQPLDTWNVSNVTDMSHMFNYNTSFDQPLNTWNVSSVTSLIGMFFEASTFNQPLDTWDVSNAQMINSLFYGATAFNQPLNTWDVSNAMDMRHMFWEATSFDQDISAWDISSTILMDHMFEGAGLSVTNYDSLLIGWARLDPGEMQVPINIVFHGGSSVYCAGEEARDSLLIAYGWTITDGGKACESFWTGDNSSDWFDAGNWTNGVPGLQTSAIIPDVGMNPYPVISIVGAECYSLELETGSTLTIQSTGHLNVTH